MNWWTLGGLVAGFVGGFVAACRAFVIMQEDFVNIFSKSPKGK